MQFQDNKQVIQRITALWALAESGLGGWMHALKLPFTGIFVGGFAVVMVALLAHYSSNHFKTILQATLMVMLVKFVASPQSPPMAYLAVGFQGMIGAIFYKLVPNFNLASILFAFIAMLESALQKLIMMTLIFGNSLWEALDAFYKSSAKNLGMSGDLSFSYWVIFTYVGIYALWGIILGIWISVLPRRIENKATDTIRRFRDTYLAEQENIIVTTGKRRKNKVLFLVAGLLFIVSVFLFSGFTSKALYAVLRTIAAVLLLFGVVGPLLRALLYKWLEKKKDTHKESMKSVMDLLPELRSHIRPAYRMAAAEHRGLRRLSSFLFILIVTTLHSIHEPAQDIYIHPKGT